MLKEPNTFKRPRLYWQPADKNGMSRMRILFPDGKTSFSFDACCNDERDWHKCCWNEPYHIDGLNLLDAMRAYDTMREFPPAEFLGEL